MRNMTLDRAISLALQIETARKDLSLLEKEFSSLMKEDDKKVQSNVKTTTESAVQPSKFANGHKPSRHRITIVRMLKTAGVPVLVSDIRNKIGISESGTYDLLRRLTMAGEIQKAGRALYTIKA